MKINHGDAIVLEHLVRRVYNCDRGGFGGYIDADIFEFEPLLAAQLALAPAFKDHSLDPKEIEDFFEKYTVILDDYIDELVESGVFEKYDHDLEALVNKAYK